jgi:hypothetical protein
MLKYWNQLLKYIQVLLFQRYTAIEAAEGGIASFNPRL